MRTLFALLVAFGSLAASAARFPVLPDLVGSWQGTLRIDSDLQFRVVVRITRDRVAGWNGTLYIADANPIPIESVMIGGSTIELIANSVRIRGEINVDGTSIRGMWIHGVPRPVDRPLPLELQRATRDMTWSLPPHPSSHITRYLTVDEGVKLEVLDWRGSGRSVVLLAGLGNDAHVFDELASKHVSHYHVYGITRRGYGNSSVPLDGYSADRLGDDVLAVLDALDLEKPILVGHSIAGEELSSIGSRYPQRVAGLIYLDAGYYYAYYDHSVVRDLGVSVDLNELERKLDQLRFGNLPANPRPLIQDVLDTQLPAFTSSLQAWQRTLQATPPLPGAPAQQRRRSSVAQDVTAGIQRYTTIPVPILAVFAAPHEPPPSTGHDPAAIAAADAADDASTGARAQADAFEKGLPSAHVVRLAHASHFVFRSNETDVLREMNAFISSLPQ